MPVVKAIWISHWEPISSDYLYANLGVNQKWHGCATVHVKLTSEKDIVVAQSNTVTGDKVSTGNQMVSKPLEIRCVHFKKFTKSDRGHTGLEVWYLP